MSKDQSKAYTIKELQDMGLVGSPPHFGKYLQRHIEKNVKSNPSREAKVLGVAPSTIKRLIDGAQLTPEMAVKLNKQYGFGFGFMFNIEAMSLAHKAEQIAEQQNA